MHEYIPSKARNKARIIYESIQEIIYANFTHMLKSVKFFPPVDFEKFLTLSLCRFWDIIIQSRWGL